MLAEQNPSAELMRLANGYQVSQAIYVAATLGIADLLGDEPRGSDDLAARTGANPGSLFHLLRALAAVGVFREEENRCFSLTPMGHCFRAGANRPAGPYAAFIGRPYQWSAWGDLLHGVRTGDQQDASFPIDAPPVQPQRFLGSYPSLARQHHRVGPCAVARQ